MTFHWLAVDRGMNDVLAGALVVFLISPLRGVSWGAVLFRSLPAAPPSARLVAPGGLGVALPPIARILYGRDEIFDSTGIGWEPARSYDVFGVNVDSNQLIVIV